MKTITAATTAAAARMATETCNEEDEMNSAKDFEITQH